jgi:hypothetical protein
LYGTACPAWPSWKSFWLIPPLPTTTKTVDPFKKFFFIEKWFFLVKKGFLYICLPFLCALYNKLKNEKFCIDVTFEMRTAIQSDAFIQLMATHKIKLSFILETEEGAKGKITERERERMSVGRQRV